MPEDKYPCGLVGAGQFVRSAYVPAFHAGQNPFFVCGILSRSRVSAERLARKLPYRSAVCEDFSRLAPTGAKAVLIASPNHTHREYIELAAQQGLDIFCEKPLVNSLNEAYALKKEFGARPLILMTGFNQRYFERLRQVKALLAEGIIGNVREVSVFHNQNIAALLRRSSWMNDQTKSGGGVIHNAGIHLINILLYLFGPVEKVTAEFFNKEVPEEFGEDTAFCEIDFANGIKGRLKASLVNQVKSSYEHMIITGEKGILETDRMTSRIIYRDTANNTRCLWCQPETTADSILNELKHFWGCIKTRRGPETDINDFIETLKVTEALKHSAQQKRAVTVKA